MSVEKLGAIGLSRQDSLGRSLSFQPQEEFSATLTRGDILKGKVLRQYEGGRYGVEFGGKERVVDSAVPLKPGEFIQGRVIAIDDKVHLQRIHDSGQQDDGRLELKGAVDRGALGQGTEAALSRFLQGLSSAQSGVLSRLSGTGKIDDQVARSALMISKMGLPVDPELVRAIQLVMTQSQDKLSPKNTSLPRNLPEAAVARPPSVEMIAALAALLQNIGDSTEGERFEALETEDNEQSDLAGVGTGDFDGDSGNGQDEKNAWRLGYWLLNAQDDSSVSHKYLVVPVWIGERLLEVEVALFSPRPGSKGQGGDTVKTSRVALSLTTESLGRVDVNLHVAERHLRYSVVTQSESTADVLAQQLPQLKESLGAFGWSIDEASYSVQREAMDSTLQLVFHHYATQDSLSQLM